MCWLFAGRVWYAGTPEGKESSFIYFSQVTTDYTKYGKCHQQNDPTSEVLSDIQDDDGGVIVIPDIGQVVALRGASDGMLVFATNGVWRVEGTDSGFSATSYIINRVTSVGCLYSGSIVEVEDTFVYFSRNGIYSIAKDGSEFNNVSDVNIKSFYNNISIESKLKAVSAYDFNRKKLYWLYPENDEVFKRKVLCYDIALRSWYTFTFAASNTYKLIGLFMPTVAAQLEQTFDVVVNNDDILVNTNQVQVDLDVTEGAESFLKYCVLVQSGNTYTLSFADTNNANFTDWNETEMPAYVITGYEMGNNGPARSKTSG